MRAFVHALRARRPAMHVRTPRDLLAGAGRLVLWLFVAIVLVRGLGATLAPADHARERRTTRVAAAAAWPDDAARSLAVEFATVYLTHTRGEDAAAASRRLGALASSELVGELAPRFDRDAPEQTVRSASVERAVVVDARHALITVAAVLATDASLSTRRLTVPVARDGAGGLVVDELPSFAAAPARAGTQPRADEPLMGSDRGAIGDVLTRFLRSYLAGDSGALAYMVSPGTRIATAAGRLQLLSVPSLAIPDTAGGASRQRVVLVTVHARDLESGALYMLRYRVGVVRRDRWYVAALNPPGER